MHTWCGSWGPFVNYPYGGIIMMFFGVLLIGLVIYLLFRGNGQTSYRSTQRAVEDPLEILKRRYADGSISEEEFIRMKSELNS